MEEKVRLAAIGVGNRTGKYLKWVLAHPDAVELTAIVEPDPVRREACRKLFNLDGEACYSSAESFFKAGSSAQAVIIGSPDSEHYSQAMAAIEAGMHVLLEKPVAQNYAQCLDIASAAERKGVCVAVCYVLRFMPTYKKIKELLEAGCIGRITNVSHHEFVGIDRMLHTYVRGYWNKASESTPSFVSKCCHDVDMLLWTTGARIKSIHSAGSLEWFRKENAPAQSTDRCISCPIERGCAYSAIDMYLRRGVWTDNFPIPEGKTKEEVLKEEMATGRFGRCAFKCGNDVADRQIVTMQAEDGTLIAVEMNAFTRRDGRRTVYSGTEGELIADCDIITVKAHHGGRTRTYDLNQKASSALHMGADLEIVEDFIAAVKDPSHRCAVSIADALESHRLCFLAG